MRAENHHPLPRFTSQIMNESLDISPSFQRYYRTRMVARLGEGDEEVDEIDRRCRRGGEEWVPNFT
jgi:putative membrane protein